MITGLNHITFSVSDLTRSVAFYTDILGCKEIHTWSGGAYLDAGGTWICLSLDSEARVQRRTDYTHVAFTISSGRFEEFRALLAELGVRTWKDNRSEGESVYFLDPDGHKLEAHVGNLQTRLESIRSRSSESNATSGCNI